MHGLSNDAPYSVPNNVTADQTIGELLKLLGIRSREEVIIPLIKYSLNLSTKAKKLRHYISDLEQENFLLKSQKKKMERLQAESGNAIQATNRPGTAQWRNGKLDSPIIQNHRSSGCASTVPCQTCCTCLANFVYDPSTHGIITDGCLWCFFNHGYCIGNCCELSG